jgi:hypothetical protein
MNVSSLLWQDMHISSFAFFESSQQFLFEDKIKEIHEINLSEEVSQSILDDVVLNQCRTVQSEQKKVEAYKFNDFESYNGLALAMLDEVTNTQLRRTAAISTLSDMFVSHPCD